MAKKTKVVDKWKLKKWYKVLAPPMFDHHEICEVAANEDRFLLNRVVEIGLNELVQSGSHSAMFTKLVFRITKVEGDKAYTALIGHSVSPSYIKTFARRGKSLVHMTLDEKTKDDQDVRLKLIAVTNGRISGTTMRNLRSAMRSKVLADIGSQSYDDLMQNILYGKFVSGLYNELKKITSMRRVEIRKTEKKEVFA